MPYGIEPKDIVIFIAGVVFTVAVSFVFYRLSKRGKRLSYAVNRRDLLSPAPLDGLSITYRGQEVEALTRFEVYIWNAGDDPIVAGDLETASPPTLTVDDLNVLDAKVRRQSREASQAAVADDLQPRFAFLNSGDGFVIDLITNAKRRKGRVWLKGDVVGIGKGPVKRDYDVASGTAPAIFLLAMGCLFGLFWPAVFGVIVNISKDGFTIGRAIGLGFACIAALVSAGLIYSALYVTFCNKMPIELLRKSDIGLVRRSLFFRRVLNSDAD